MLVLCPYPFGVAAGQRLKFEQYYDDWRRNGWTVDVAPFMDLDLWRVVYRRGHFFQKALGTVRGYARRLRDLTRVARYDLVYCHMYVTPLGGNLFERLTRRLAKKLVFDLEDNILIKLDRASDPNLLLRLARSTDKMRYLIRRADHVITSSPFLNETCLAINERKACTYISSSVDTDRFVPSNGYSNERTIVIGWTGTFSTRIYLDLLRGVFQRLAARRRFRLRVIGNFDYDLPGVDLEVVRWTAEREVQDLQALDIGVYPLPVDEWVTGKSGLKAIQYMAFGLPCVATDVGTTPMIIRNGENGLLVQTDDQWIGALQALIDDPGLRRRLGEQARRDAVEKYSTRATEGKYRQVLDRVMSERGSA
jgi:glycosyltransferase involved in cell wall biosynthesis